MATYSELKNQLVSEFNVSDSTSIANAGTDINYWYEHIWNSALWNESKGTTTVSYPSGSATITLGSVVDFVISASWDGNPITNISREEVLAINPEELTNNGTPYGFINHPFDSNGNAVISLVPLPSDTANVFILYKTKFVKLSADSDTPRLRGIDEAILSYARVSFLRRDYQYAKASQMRGEADGMLIKMVDIEKNQQQKIMTIIPESYDVVYGEYSPDVSKSRIYG